MEMTFLNYELSPSKHASEADLSELKEHLGKYTSLEELVLSWLKKGGRKVFLGTGYDDDEKHTLVALSLEQAHSAEVATLYIPRDAVLAAYPGLRPISVECPLNTSHSRESRLLDARTRRLKGKFDDELCQNVFPEQSVLPLCLQYAIDDIGEAYIAPADEWVYEDISEEYQSKGIYSIMLSYAESTSSTQGIRNGCGENAYFFLGDTSHHI